MAAESELQSCRRRAVQGVNAAWVQLSRIRKFDPGKLAQWRRNRGMECPRETSQNQCIDIVSRTILLVYCLENFSRMPLDRHLRIRNISRSPQSFQPGVESEPEDR
jgi:hypothetical protein